ncbi:hypothetical protein PR202_ga08840 [Eleusine coracana subsp. coracana]|uniref:Scarecrow-like protein 1 n=1 Tax=Eleusine coracana subsp. coracana TaxID=191504 RepID=A0AAV5C106_ELECO|nr:hypothetical protein PR202_ga08840 [Eleusine coracana subsp. coracana]
MASPGRGPHARAAPTGGAVPAAWRCSPDRNVPIGMELVSSRVDVVLLLQVEAVGGRAGGRPPWRGERLGVVGVSFPVQGWTTCSLGYDDVCVPKPIQSAGLINQYHITADGRSTTADTQSNSCSDAAKDSPVFSNVSQQNSQSVSDSQGSGIEVEFDEDEMRVKLQELEHALFDDGDDILFEISQTGSINDEWADPMKNVLIPNSPKDSESSVSCAVSNNEATRTPKQLLFDCAMALSEYNVDEAQAIITELRQMVSIQGDPSQRIAAYLVEGLAARIVASGKGIYKALTCKDPPTLYQLSAMQILFEICPCFRLGFMAANYAILEACKGEERVHIIDFDINQGSQYITLIQFMKSNANKPRHLRITGVDDPETVQRPIGGLRVIGQRLEKLAEDCGVSFEFRAVGANIGDVTPAMLDCHPGEALVVSFAFQLHHLPDESVSIMNERDQLLRMVKGLQPKLVTLVEQDANTKHCTVPDKCLAREIVNILACEGPDRVERYEVAGKWRARMTMAGFKPCPFNSNVISGIRSLLKSYCDRYKFVEDHGGLHFGWGEKSLIVSSAWQ